MRAFIERIRGTVVQVDYFGLTISLLAVLAFGCIIHGLWLAWEPAGWIGGGLAGLVVLAAVTRWHRAGDDRAP